MSKKLLISTLSIFFSYSCTTAQKTIDSTPQAPSKEKKEINFSYLDWTLSAPSITRNCRKAQADLDLEIQDIIKTSKPNLENTLERSDRAFSNFLNRTSPLHFYQYVYHEENLVKAARECQEESEKLHLSIISNPSFYKVIKTAAENHRPKDAIQKRLLEEYMQTFKENGLLLSDKKRKELLKIRNEIVTIESAFMETVTSWDKKIHFTKKELNGLPQSLLNSLEKSKKKGKEVVLTLKYPHVIPAFKYVKNPKTRKEIYLHFHTRGGKKNSKRLSKTLELRLKVAKILGYPDYATYKLDDRMAKSPQKVQSFLADLKQKLKQRTKIEFNALLDAKRKDLKNPKIENLNPWDLLYYETKLKEEKYSVSELEIKEYFPTLQTLHNMLEVYETIFNVNFQKNLKIKTWHKDVVAYDVYDKWTKEHLGFFYMDLYPRKGKYGHAAKFTLSSGYEKENKNTVLPIAAVLTNFAKPTKQSPSLLTHREVETLFHEFGHVVHHVLSKTRYGSFSGTRVKRDFVEAPSQMLENWVWEKSILKKLSSHYKTKKAMPNDLIERLIKTRTFNKGISTTKQIFYASIDMFYHTLKSTKNLNVTNSYHKLFRDIFMLKPLKGTHTESSFGHLMGGYGAGYYGYLWSEVYAFDMYTRFQKEGLLNSKTGQEYRSIILERGGSEDPMELVKKFLKRDPNNEAFLSGFN